MSAPSIALPALDPDTVAEWLSTTHDRSTGHAWLGSTHDRFRGRCFDVSSPGWVRAATAYVQQLDRTGTPGIYLRTTTLRSVPREGRGGDDDSLTLPGLAADLDLAGPGHKTSKPLPPDVDAARNIIDESGLLQPTLWIHSGGGLYAWWLLDQPHTIGADLARIKRLTARWQDPIAAASERLGYSYGRLGDLARILRIPGTINRKPGMPAPAPCRIIENGGRRYSLANIRASLTDALDAMPAIEPRRIIRRPAGSGWPDGNPVAEFEAAVDWVDILTPHGWTFAYEHGGTRYWCRPGKNRRDGISATTGRAADRDRIFVFTDATVLPQNEPTTKFHALALLEHGGSHADAVRALRRQGFGRYSGRVAA